MRNDRAYLAGLAQLQKTPDGEEIAYDVAGGFLSVTHDGVTVLAESAEPAEGDDPAHVAALGGTSADVH